MKAYEKMGFDDYTYPDDMMLILGYLAKHGKINVSGKTIEQLYGDFSEKMYCANWIRVSIDRLEDFAGWLTEIEI